MDHDENYDEVESPRQAKRRRVRETGNRSARVARALLELRQPVIDALKLNDDIRSAIDRARAVKAKGARRREERRLAGVLRDTDLADVEAQLHAFAESGQADVRKAMHERRS